jgi:hypothetical protein
MTKARVINAEKFPVSTNELSKYSISLLKGTRKIDLGNFEYSLKIDRNQKNILDIKYKSTIEYLLEGTTTENVALTVDSAVHRPLKLNCEFWNIQQNVVLSAEYKKKKVVMNAIENGCKDRWVERIPFQVLDNYQMFISLRALNYNESRTEKFSLVNCLTCSVTEIDCIHNGIERVKTNLGVFDCHRICLQLYKPVAFTQYNLYTVEKPHHLIKVIKGPIVYELSEVTNRYPM